MGIGHCFGIKKGITPDEVQPNIEFQTKLDIHNALSTDHEAQNKKEYEILAFKDLGSSTYDIKKVYAFESQLIGKGTYSKVRKALLRHDGHQMYTVKTIKKKSIEKHINFIKRELDILRQIDHPNIAFFFESYHSTEEFHFVIEYCGGGEFEQVLEQKGQIYETEAALYMYDMLLAVSYLHNLGIAHRDLKPQNFMVCKDADATIKLVDFSLSKNFKVQKLLTPVGSPYYVAPEVINGEAIDERSDIWSLGIIMYRMITGHFPFKANNRADLLNIIKNEQFELRGAPLSSTTEDCIQVLEAMVQKDPDQRKTAQEILKMPFFEAITNQAIIKGRDAMTDKRVKALRSHHELTMFKKRVLIILVQITVYPEEISALKDAFIYLDRDKTGVVTTEDLVFFFEENGYTFTMDQAKDLLQQVCLRTPDYMSYIEFLAATIDRDYLLSKSNLELGFRRFDIDNSGNITELNLMECFRRFGYKLSLEKAQEMIAEVDKENKGVISEARYYEHMTK